MTRAKEHLALSFAATEKGAAEWAGQVVSRLGMGLRGGEGEDSRAWIRCVRQAPQRSAPRAPAAAEEREERLARPALAGQYDSSVAVTSVVMFQECPRQYFLARYLGWPQQRPAQPPLEEERDQTEVDPAELGTQVHDLLAGILFPEAAPEALELAARFRSSELGRRAAAAGRVEREFDFLLEVEEVLLLGRIDLWFEEGDELVLVDYKTDDVPVAEAAVHAQSYALQLQLYALALERAAGRLPDRALIYLLRPNVAVPVSLHQEDLEAARGAVLALRQAQEEMCFPVRTGAHCTRCAYFAGLCLARAAAATPA